MNREQKIAVLAAAADACPDPERKAKYLAQKHVLILAATREERERENLEQQLRNWEARRHNFWKLESKKKDELPEEKWESLFNEIHKNIDNLKKEIYDKDQKSANEKQERYQEFIEKRNELLKELDNAYEENDMEKAKNISEKIAKMNNSYKGNKITQHKEKEARNGNSTHPGCNQYEHKPGCPRDKD